MSKILTHLHVFPNHGLLDQFYKTFNPPSKLRILDKREVIEGNTRHLVVVATQPKNIKGYHPDMLSVVEGNYPEEILRELNVMAQDISSREQLNKKEI